MNNWITTILLLVPFLLSAQSGTTLEEYRFLSKGYAYQQSMGLDASKNGYDIKSIGPDLEQVEYIGLFLVGQKTPQAILLVLKSDTANPVYLCLPNNQANDRVMELHQLDREQIADPSVWELYDSALRQLAFHLISQPYNDLLVAKTIMESSTALEEEQAFGNHTKQNIVTNNQLEKPLLVTTTEVEKDIPAEFDFTEKSIPQTSADNINTSVAIHLDEVLTTRGVLSAPVIKGPSSAKGKVAIKFCVDKEGKVTSAKFTQRGSTTFNKTLISRAIDSVQKSAFAKGDKVECGKAVFHFQ